MSRKTQNHLKTTDVDFSTYTFTAFILRDMINFEDNTCTSTVNVAIFADHTF